MRKTVIITGLVYNMGENKLVDYGFGSLYRSMATPSSDSVDKCCLEDTSLCPPLYDELQQEFKPGVDYKAKVISIEKSESWVRILVNGVFGFIYFDHLAKYWGSLSCLYKNYQEDTEIDVQYLATKQNSNDKQGIKFFTEKGVRKVPFTSISYKVGDIVDIHIGPIDGKKSLVWFNGNTVEILPKFDILFRKRVHNHVYYPGRPVKAEITRVDDSQPGKRFFKFTIKHEYVDYGLHIGEYPCLISEQFGKKYALIKTEIEEVSRNYCFEIPQSEVPRDFPGFDKTKFPATIRISSFDAIGEPQIQFASLMKELFSRHEGETFDIKLVKPNDQGSNYRIWTGSNGLCGIVTKSSLAALGDKTAGLYGQLVHGEIHVSKRGESLIHIKVNDVYKAIIIERNSLYFTLAFHDRQAFLFNISHVEESIDTLDVRVVHIDNAASLILCVPAEVSSLFSAKIVPRTKVALQFIRILNGFVIFSDGLHIGIMPVHNWDWSNGKTIESIQEHSLSLYVNLFVEDITDTGVLLLDRRPLIDNPWTNINLAEGQPIKVHIECITNSMVTVSFNSIITDIKWSNFCPYEYSYGQYLYEEGNAVELMVKGIDKIHSSISLTYLPENGVKSDLFFDKTVDYPATVIKQIPQGVLVTVDSVYGVIPKKYLLKESLYKENSLIKVRFVKRSYSTSSNYIEFSHIATIDTSTIIKYGHVIQAAILEKVYDNWLLFSSEGLQIYSHKKFAKYFSADRDMDFSEKMIPGQSFSLRIIDVPNMRAVPDGMPDYSCLPIGKEYNGRINAILESGYLVFIDELNDIFYVPFAKYCDWGEHHFETRIIDSPIKATLVSYSKSQNVPFFSLIAGKDDPWKDLSEGDMIDVDSLGSALKKNDFYVNVRGIPVLLSNEAICALIGKPWIGEALSYISIERLEGVQSFKMDILSIDKTRHTIKLMPHLDAYPRIIRRADIIHRQRNNVWVRCGNNIIGYLPEEEVPEGYIIGNKIEQAVCKSFVREKGYVTLSVKDLFTTIEDNKDINSDERPLKGILVTQDTVLKERQVVRGILKNVDNQRERIFIQVGPYLGMISYFELSHLKCDAPRYIFEKDKEYDFSISRILDNPKGKLLVLSRKPLLPTPPKEIEIGQRVNARVCRFDSTKEIIVVNIDKFDGIEAIIYPSDLVGCKIGEKTIYPKIGFHFTAEISSIETNKKTGSITRIRLTKGA